MTVELVVEDQVAWIHLNRPERLNAVTAALVEDLVSALERAADEAAVAVLAGRGRAFCAGHDLKEPVPLETPVETGQRMIAAGANMMTWMALGAEWQRDWARTAHAGQLTEILKQHAAGSGIAYLWEQQLLNTPVPASVG